jgi:hypothetical protein
MSINFENLFKLRLLVGRFGEMDAARWWNTGDSGRRSALLGAAGAVLLSRGFPRTHYFAQARLVFEVARARCAEVFDPPGCVTLWSLPAEVEDQFDARWATWLEERDSWVDFFAAIAVPPAALTDWVRAFGLVSESQLDAASGFRRAAEGRSVPIPGIHELNDALVTQLAIGFSRAEPGKLSVPYARVES